MLATDASLAIELCLDRVGDNARSAFADDELVAPPLLWSEVPSVIHELAYRGEISGELSDAALHALLNNTIGIPEVRPARLITTAWQLATEFGWAKTYDAEYLATAQLLGCRLATVDARLRRGADRLGYVVTPSELR
jgi:predicted nucleic acid-binding protein